MKRENFYRRNPGDALSGMVGMTLEERGVYNTIIDLIYLTWRPLEDSRSYIAGHCGCAVQRLNPIISRLIEKRKLLRFEEDGVWYLSNRRFEDERSEVKGASESRSGRGKVEEKSGEVEEKSGGVGENSPLLDTEDVEKQAIRPLDRVEEEKRRDSVASAAPTATIALLALDIGSSLPVRQMDRDPDFGKLWDIAPPLMRRRAKSKSKVWPEWQRARKFGLPSAILGGFARYKALDADLPRTGGPGLHIWLKDRTWEQWSSATDAADRTASWGDAEWGVALRHWRAEQLWDDALGPKPGEPGCRAPAKLLMTAA